MRKKGEIKMELIINYCNGFVENVDCANLDEAKDLAVQGMSYTQANVRIESGEGELLSTSHWYGVEPNEDDTPLETFGTFGFYGDWVDE